MKQTAISWFSNEMLYLDNEYDMKLIDKNEYQARRKALIEEAKSMEKEQIIEAHLDGQTTWDVTSKTAEQYYNETFKSE